MASFGLDMVRQTLDSARAEYEDNTDGIRQARASARLRADVDTITSAIVHRATMRCRLGAAPIPGVATDQTQQVAALTELDLEELFVECKESAKFLFENMPVVFAKLFQNQLDVPLFMQMLDVLETVERGERDQNEGSEEVGRMLHRCFIGGHVPAAVGGRRTGNNNGDKEGGDGTATGTTTNKKQQATLTWAEYRAQRNQGTYTDMQRVQCTKEASRAKLRAAIELKKQQSRGGKK